MNGTNAGGSKKGVAFLHISAFLLVIVLNSLAVFLPLNGKTTGQLSDLYPNLFTPAGLTFSIWSLIYLMLLGFVIYQAIVLFKTQHPSRKKIILISWPFLVNCLANAAWIVAWHFEQVVLSVFIMLILLISLIVIHSRLQLALPAKPLAEKLWLDYPFSLYFGWISIATIANITALLVHLNWNGGGISSPAWTVVMISIGTLLNVYMILFKKNLAFGLVGIWAFYGIILKRHSADDDNINQIIFCAELCISVLAFSIFLQIFRFWKRYADNGKDSEHTIIENEISKE
ncbi:MAG: hypothetical protein ABIN89_01390 [Chitinophagaceae bacterium]